ncbi:hypothetical protein EON65_40995 [archaeon]|nr:MAG: hypothetical protein EON65_40995 [archaeon]
MDPVSTVTSIIRTIGELKGLADQAKANKVACRDFVSRLDALCPVLLKPGIAGQAGDRAAGAEDRALRRGG